MEDNDWVLITVRCSHEAAEAVREVVLALTGQRGTVEETRRKWAIISAYVPADPQWTAVIQRLSERLVDVRMHFPDACIEGPVATLVPSQDWSEVWKREYKTIRVGRVLIKPTWAATPEIAPGSVLVTLDPQMAFGTGSHASTQLALEALQACIRPGQVLADIGTGTGILAIAAALLGARRVYAVDNDPIAVRAARANCRLNGVDKMVELRCAESLSGLPQALDGIVANISPHVDIELARAAPRYLKPGAFLVLSGFTEKSEEEVTAAMLEAGFSISTRYCEGEWVCLAAAFLPDDEVG